MGNLVSTVSTIMMPLRHQFRIALVNWMVLNNFSSRLLENKFCCFYFYHLQLGSVIAHDNFSNRYHLIGSCQKNKAFQTCRLIGWHMSGSHWQCCLEGLRVIACNIHESGESECRLLSPLVPPLTPLRLCLVDTLSRLCLEEF